MIPAIPEGCERFRQDEIGRWEFQFPGCIDDTEIDAINKILGNRTQELEAELAKIER